MLLEWVLKLCFNVFFAVGMDLLVMVVKDIRESFMLTLSIQVDRTQTLYAIVITAGVRVRAETVKAVANLRLSLP